MTHNKSKIGIGIDFGTSNSVAAIYDGEKAHLVPLDDSRVVMPTASYVMRDFTISVGQKAIDDFIFDNQGRRVELSAEFLGEERTSAGGLEGPAAESETSKVFGQAINDMGLPGRLFRGTKRLLGESSNERITVFQRNFRLVALVTPILVRICDSLRQVSGSANHASIGYPVEFEGHEKNRNELGLKRLQEAYTHAGILRQHLCPEPVAAAISYLNQNTIEERSLILTLDFGGGTLDLSILNSDGFKWEVVATHGVALGGDKIDQTIFRKLICPLLGKGERWSRVLDGEEVNTLFPFSEFEELLLNWPVSYMLNQNKFTAPVTQRMMQSDSGAKKFKRLYDLIHQNYSYHIFEAIRDLKVKLSSVKEATIDLPEIDVEVSITRDEFESLISGILRQLEQSIEQVLVKAGKTLQDIDLVIRTGGSSQIPAVKKILENMFPDKVIEHDPFTSVATGLAMEDYFKSETW
jgi:hypothetical chaperone protein